MFNRIIRSYEKPRPIQLHVNGFGKPMTRVEKVRDLGVDMNHASLIFSYNIEKVCKKAYRTLIYIYNTTHSYILMLELPGTMLWLRSLFYVMANKQTSYLMAGDHSRPWTFATSECLICVASFWKSDLLTFWTAPCPLWRPRGRTQFMPARS